LKKDLISYLLIYIQDFNKKKKILEEDSILENDNLRDLNDLNDLDLHKKHYKLLRLDSYDIYPNERDLIQPRYDCANQDKENYYFNNEDINTDEDYDSLKVDSVSPFPLYYKPITKTFHFYNIISNKKIKDIEADNVILKINENFE
jgi:hypothetical protein